MEKRYEVMIYANKRVHMIYVVKRPLLSEDVSSHVPIFGIFWGDVCRNKNI